jgi:hypothetical protein
MTAATVPVIRPGWACDDLCLDPPGWTVIQVARSVVFDGETLVLVDLAPTMPYLSASMPTVLGHLSTGGFLDLWGAGGQPSAVRAARPGVLSLADPERSVFGDAMVLLAGPRIHDAGLTYDVSLVEGSVPLSSGSCVLYVNARVPTVPDGVGPGVGPDRRTR